jgi:hypothetical protein
MTLARVRVTVVAMETQQFVLCVLLSYIRHYQKYKYIESFAMKTQHYVRIVLLNHMSLSVT